MNNQYIILDSEGKYLNSVVWDGDLTTWQPPEGTTAVPLNQANIDTFLTEKYTAEEWITKSGYTAIQLITLLDLEMKLLQTNKTSQKMTLVRQWMNGLLQVFVTDPTPKSNWPDSPYTFEETVQEALFILSN
jgi:hypothetical protein